MTHLFLLILKQCRWGFPKDFNTVLQSSVQIILKRMIYFPFYTNSLGLLVKFHNHFSFLKEFSWDPGGRSPDRVKGSTPCRSPGGQSPLCIFFICTLFLYLCNFFRSQNLRIATTCCRIHNVTDLYPASHVRKLRIIYELF